MTSVSTSNGAKSSESAIPARLLRCSVAPLLGVQEVRLRCSLGRASHTNRSHAFSAFLVIVLLAHAAFADSALFPYEGRPIIALEITGATGSNKALVQSLIDIEPGYLFSSDDLSRGVRRLFSLGRFADVTVRAEALEKAIILHVDVVEQEQIGELELKGDSDEEVRREMKGMVQKRQAFDRATLESLQKRCEKTWETLGYFKAQCTVTSQHNSKGSVDITVASKAGEPTSIARIEFVGDRKVEAVFLRNELALGAGDRFAEKAFKADERALRMAYFKRGFLTAQVRGELVREAGGVVLRYVIAGGPRVSLKLKGMKSFTEESLRSLLKRADDEPLTKTTLDAWRRAVHEKYQAHGFAFADVKIESYYEASKHVVHHVLAIDEQQRSEVAELRFPGSKHFTEARLKEEVVAFVNEALDPSIISGELNRGAVRSLADGQAGIPDAQRLVSPRHTHWLYRQDPARTYLPEAYRAAVDAIRKLYLEQGFTRVEVGPVAVTPRVYNLKAGFVPSDVDIDVPVKEGPRSMIHVIAFSGSQAVESDQLFALSKLEPGAPYSELLVEETQNEIQKAMHKKGYMYARIDHTSDFSPDLATVDLRFNITEGPQVLVGRVLVQGSDRTKDYVVRDRVMLEPGKPYSPEDAQATKDELTKLEVFGSASVGLTDPEVPGEQKDVLIRLLERDTQSIEAGFGFSTTQGLRGYVEYNERNLFGTAQLLSVRLQLNRQFLFIPIFYNKWADVMAERYAETFQRDALSVIFFSIERQARISWRTPRGLKLPGRPQVYADFVNERINTIPFSLDTVSFLTGVDLRPSPIIGLTLETSIAYNALQCFPLRASDAVDREVAPEHAEIDTPERTSSKERSQTSSCDTRNFGSVLAVVPGIFVNWKTGPSFTLDLRDDKLNTHSGLLASLKADLVVGQQLPSAAGPTPADPRYSFVKLESHVTGYIPVTKRSELVLSGRVGNIFRVTGEEGLLRAQLNERFFLGGRNTLRGYADRTVLPEDACVVEQSDPPKPCAQQANRVEYDKNKVYTPVPGAFFVLAKAEFRFPIIGNFRGAVFVDAGNLYFSAAAFNPLAWRVNVGAGLRYETGVGSVAADIGFNPSFRDERAETAIPNFYFYFGLF